MQIYIYHKEENFFATAFSFNLWLIGSTIGCEVHMNISLVTIFSFWCETKNPSKEDE